MPDVQTAVQCGFQVNTHAIGDRANRVVLDAYEAATAECSSPLLRPRIEHAQIVVPDDRPRFGELDVIASVQPQFAPSDMGWAPARLGPNRIDRAYAWRSLHDAGARLAFGSDAPVEPIDPIQGFHAAVTRQDAEGNPEEGWQPSERVDRWTALRAYTRDAAYAAFREDEWGTIAPGKRADLVVLSQDIMTAPREQLLDTAVVATYVDGRCVYGRSDWPGT
ncbi:MAG: amidohydrolase [Salinibacter sp.]